MSEVELHSEDRTAKVIVPDNQLSLAIGKEGQNARLAAKITGWKIDICSETQIAQERLSSLGLIDSDSPGDGPAESDPAEKETVEDATLESETTTTETAESEAAKSEPVESETGDQVAADSPQEPAPEEASAGDDQTA